MKVNVGPKKGSTGERVSGDTGIKQWQFNADMVGEERRSYLLKKQKGS